MNTWGSWWTPS